MEDEEKTPTDHIKGWDPIHGFSGKPKAPVPILCYVCGYKGAKDDRIVSVDVCGYCVEVVLDL